jgi:hypothetical protein
MEIERWTWETGTRPCRVALCLEDGSVFADFDVDASSQCVFLIRISFDGYGCCHSPEGIGRMTLEESKVLLDPTVEVALVEPILRRYFRDNEQLLWSDALREHELV